MPGLGIPPALVGRDREALPLGPDDASVAPISQRGTGEAQWAPGAGPSISSSAGAETRTVSMETGSPNLAQNDAYFGQGRGELLGTHTPLPAASSPPPPLGPSVLGCSGGCAGAGSPHAVGAG